MNEAPDPPRESRPLLGDHALRLFRIFGIEVRLDVSVLVIFGLIVFSLGSGLLPQWHPDWGAGLRWTTAFVAGVLFFASLLAHELAHSVVALRYGIPVPRITLFLFGGVAETGQEPDSAKVEFLVAIAGPLMSIAIGLGCSVLAGLLIDDDALLEQLSAGEESAFAALGPVATGLVWLGSVNLILAFFNLIPGFPMDGGRVFRALIWSLTGDQLKATRWASYGGRIFGWSLMALGVLSLLGGRAVSGLWTILIGWFISNIARMSYSQLVTSRALKGFRVDDLMNTRFDTVPDTLPLTTFIDRHLLHSSQQVWPVHRDDRLVGFICLDDVVGTEPDARPGHAVAEVMRPLGSLRHLDADAGARRALQDLASADVEPVPVMRGDRLVGFLSQRDVMRWLALHDPE
jgi:Zn-dependent protease